MLTERILECISNEVITGAFGTRNAENKPKVGTPLNIKSSDDKRNIKMLVPTLEFQDHLENLNSNGQIALTFACVPSHEAFQVKGKFKNSSIPSDEYLAKSHQDWNNYQSKLLEFGFPESLVNGLKNYNVDAVTLIEFEAEEIFDQTPKPGTGNKI